MRRLRQLGFVVPDQRVAGPARALGRLAAPERFRHQGVGEDQPGFGNVGDRQQHIGGFVGRRIVAPDPGGIASCAQERAAKRRRPAVETAISTLT